MKAPCLFYTAIVAGQLVIDSAGTVSLAGTHLAPPALHIPMPQPMLIQGVQPPMEFQDRIRRLHEHRSVMENALRAPRQAAPARSLEPQSAPLQPSEPTHSITPQEPLAERPQPAQAEAQVSCEAAGEIVENYGFSSIRPTDCSGRLYTFSAVRDGTAYSITITAAGGEIAEVRRE